MRAPSRRSTRVCRNFRSQNFRNFKLTRAHGSYAAYAKLSVIKEANGVPSAVQMIKELVEGQEAVARTARALFPLIERASDQPTADLLTQRMQIHEKNAWMLRSMLE